MRRVQDSEYQWALPRPTPTPREPVVFRSPGVFTSLGRVPDVSSPSYVTRPREREESGNPTGTYMDGTRRHNREDDYLSRTR